MYPFTYQAFLSTVYLLLFQIFLSTMYPLTCQLFRHITLYTTTLSTPYLIHLSLRSFGQHIPQTITISPTYSELFLPILLSHRNVSHNAP
ncbi:uncharacterized protein F5147DRAFT_676428 [Suillus discolor]|uniref:Uncharacterized protein n=1 Tax=Suillus discolor TaxID=1912936 RepID=A0A9P7FEE5_9AGAM|nr:uncharacterized protein F5147DRAFT_676428 [Suillus discolor]KAG2115150.1 hypothetical protein F5147DRAFT_676428 [Suillus discolor]